MRLWSQYDFCLFEPFRRIFPHCYRNPWGGWDDYLTFKQLCLDDRFMLSCDALVCDPVSDTEVKEFTDELPMRFANLDREWASLREVLGESKELPFEYAFTKGRFKIDIE